MMLITVQRRLDIEAGSSSIRDSVAKMEGGSSIAGVLRGWWLHYVASATHVRVLAYHPSHRLYMVFARTNQRRGVYLRSWRC